MENVTHANFRAMAEVNATHLHRFSEAERLGKLYLERMRDLGDPVGIQQAQASIGYIHDLHARNLHDKGRNNHQVLVKAARQFVRISCYLCSSSSWTWLDFLGGFRTFVGFHSSMFSYKLQRQAGCDHVGNGL